MLMRFLLAAAVTAFCGLSLWQIISPPDPKLIYNPSPSAQIGWYAVQSSRPLKRDDLAAAFAPSEARELASARGYLPSHVPFIKTVWAIGGERVCHDGQLVRVPNRPDMALLAQDGLGRALPRPSGCYQLDQDEVFLISPLVTDSWDSRYFGPVNISDVIGPVLYLGERRSSRQGLGTGSGRGGQDKRREAHSAPKSLSAHHFWEAYCERKEAPQSIETEGVVRAWGRPVSLDSSCEPPGTPK